MLLSSSRGVRVTVKADGCRGSGRETAPTANQPGGGGGGSAPAGAGRGLGPPQVPGLGQKALLVGRARSRLHGK